MGGNEELKGSKQNPGSHASFSTTYCSRDPSPARALPPPRLPPGSVSSRALSLPAPCPFAIRREPLLLLTNHWNAVEPAAFARRLPGWPLGKPYPVPVGVVSQWEPRPQREQEPRSSLLTGPVTWPPSQNRDKRDVVFTYRPQGTSCIHFTDAKKWKPRIESFIRNGRRRSS